MDLLEQCGGELTPENEQAIDAMILEIKENAVEKTQNICNMLAHMKARAAMFKEREEIFNKSRKSVENAAERIRERLKEFGIETGLLTCSEDVPGSKKKKPGNKIETKDWTVSVQNAGGKQALTLDEAYPDIPEEYLTYLPPVINKEAVRAAMEEGKTLPFAKLEPKGVNLVIR